MPVRKNSHEFFLCRIGSKKVIHWGFRWWNEGICEKGRTKRSNRQPALDSSQKPCIDYGNANKRDAMFTIYANLAHQASCEYIKISTCEKILCSRNDEKYTHVTVSYAHICSDRFGILVLIGISEREKIFSFKSPTSNKHFSKDNENVKKKKKTRNEREKLPLNYLIEFCNQTARLKIAQILK